MPDSADRRAERKLLAEAYKRLPPREVLQAATELERVMMQRAAQNDQAALQKGSLAVAVLSQIPRDDENNKPLFADARGLLHEILKRGMTQLQQSDRDEPEGETDEIVEDGERGRDDLLA